jgi:hypothetical protein
MIIHLIVYQLSSVVKMGNKQLSCVFTLQKACSVHVMHVTRKIINILSDHFLQFVSLFSTVLTKRKSMDLNINEVFWASD